MDEKDGAIGDDFRKLSFNDEDVNYDNDLNIYQIDDLQDKDTTDSMPKDFFSRFSRFNGKREPSKNQHLNPKFIPKLFSKRNEVNYYMDHKSRGKCVIINNTYFDSPTLPERKGTQVDRDRLTCCFKKLDFEVLNWDEKDAIDIRISIDKLAREDFTDQDCLVVCVLTHGDTNCLYAKDDKYYVEYLFDSFKSDVCRTLAGKPKIFIIQACRGDRLDNGSIINFDVEDSKSSDIRIPQWADFLMAYSTIPGFYSWRNTTNGSWFIQAFTSVLMEHYKDLDLLSILTITNQKVAYDFESNTPNLPDFHQRKQIPMIASMLTRKVFFNKAKPKKILSSKSSSDIKQLNQKATSSTIASNSSSSSLNHQHLQNQLIANNKSSVTEQLTRQHVILNEKFMRFDQRNQKNNTDSNGTQSINQS